MPSLAPLPQSRGWTLTALFVVSRTSPILMSIPIALLLAYYVYQYYLEQRTT